MLYVLLNATVEGSKGEMVQASGSVHCANVWTAKGLGAQRRNAQLNECRLVREASVDAPPKVRRLASVFPVDDDVEQFWKWAKIPHENGCRVAMGAGACAASVREGEEFC